MTVKLCTHGKLIFKKIELTICIKWIWCQKTCKCWYAMKPKQPTNQSGRMGDEVSGLISEYSFKIGCWSRLKKSICSTIYPWFEEEETNWYFSQQIYGEVTRKVFAKWLGSLWYESTWDWTRPRFQSQVELYQRLKKWYMLPCFILSIIRYGWRAKWRYPRKEKAHSPIPRCSSYLNGSFRVAFDYRRQLLLTLYMEKGEPVA